MTREEMREVADEAAEKAVQGVFLALGIDLSKPESVLTLQADLQHLRRWRKSVEQAERIGWGVIITTLVSGVVGALWLGIREMLHK